MSASLPRISIITPSLNQAAFIERTIRSVLDQGYPELEYMVLDGGSTDGSVEIIRKYADRLAWWTSGPDGGQSRAINTGLRRATGEIVAFINSDDYYEPGALHAAAGVLAEASGPAWLCGQTRMVGPDGSLAEVYGPEDEDVALYMRDRALCVFGGSFRLGQPACFWRREAFGKAGVFREDMHYAFDREFVIRLMLAGLRPVVSSRPLANFVRHPESKTGRGREPFRKEEKRFFELFAPMLTETERERARFLLAMQELWPTLGAGPLAAARLLLSGAACRYPVQMLGAIWSRMSGKGWLGDGGRLWRRSAESPSQP